MPLVLLPNFKCFSSLFFTDATAVSGAFYGQGSGNVLYSELQCFGSEESIVECQANSQPVCTHANDAGVQCQNSKAVV